MSIHWVYHELYESTLVINIWFRTLGELENIFNIFSNSIDWEIMGQDEMRFEILCKYYLNYQWLLCKEQTRFNITNILYVLKLNQNIIDEMILIILKKLVTKRLSQTTNDFSNI